MLVKMCSFTRTKENKYILNFTFNPSKYLSYYTYIRITIFFIILQDNFDTVTAERVENVWEEDSMKIKTEQHYIQLVQTVKSEEEVRVVCWCIL